MFGSFTSSVRFGAGTGAILFEQMTCNGNETSLQAPSCLRYSNPEYCSHSSDVGVWCDRLDSSGECCILQLIKVCVHVNNKEFCNLKLAMISRKS